MSNTSSLELPVELKERIERVAKERNEEPATLLACAIDSLLHIEEAQLGEVHRRDGIDGDKCYTNEEAFTKLESFRPSHRTSPPK